MAIRAASTWEELSRQREQHVQGLRDRTVLGTIPGGAGAVGRAGPQRYSPCTFKFLQRGPELGVNPKSISHLTRGRAKAQIKATLWMEEKWWVWGSPLGSDICLPGLLMWPRPQPEYKVRELSSVCILSHLLPHLYMILFTPSTPSRPEPLCMVVVS